MYRVRGQFIAYALVSIGLRQALSITSRAMNCAVDAIHLVPTDGDATQDE